MVLLTTALGGLAAIGRSLFRVSQQWVHVGEKLDRHTEAIENVIKEKERDHGRLEKLFERADARIERHEQWHSNRTPLTKE